MVAGTELSDLRKLTVVKLRERLSGLGLPTSGLKADLVERLFKFHKEEEGNDDDDDGPNDNMDTNIPPPKEPPRTALQMRLQQMAGQPDKKELGGAKSAGPPPMPPSSSKGPPPMSHSKPPPLMSKPVQPPRSQMIQKPPPVGPPSLLAPPQGPPQGPPQVPPPGPPGPPGPPPGMQQGQPPPRPPTSQSMGQPSHLSGPPPQQMNQPPPQMGMPPPPRPQMAPPPPQMMQPPQVQEPDLHEKIAMQTRMLEQERQQQEQQRMREQEQQRMREQEQQRMREQEQQRMREQEQQRMREQEQQRMREQEQQRMREQEQQRMREQQQKERMAIQQQAMMLQQQQSGEGDDGTTDLMEKVRQQQIMLEQQKQKERMEQQQKAMMEQQNQAMKKQEEDRKRKEAELLRQQQIAVMEAQRDEQQKRMREERGPPPPQRPPMEQMPSLSQSGPFNPRPNMPPRGMLPPPFMPPNSTAGIPPLIGPGSEPIRPPRSRTPPEEKEKAEPKEVKLAPALEKVLAFKDVRAQEVGLTPEELEQLNMPEEKSRDDEDDDEIEMVEMEDEEREAEEEEEVAPTESKKESKNKRRKKKKKKSKKVRTMAPTKRRIIIPLDKKDEVQIEYVQEQLDLDPTDPNYFTFSQIFDKFKISEEPKEVPKVVEAKPEKLAAEPKIKGKFDMTDDDDDDDDDEADDKQDSDVPKLSKKKLKKLTRLSVAQLKQLVQRPDVVEMHDVTAQDPRLCVHLKATRNTVPVPRHWCFKRKYLQGKRGIEKPPFELPDYIQATGITEMRAALAEKEDQKNMKAKMREKVRPKMGKIDIDYQKLHDAFFRWQTKPKMTIHGDLYYEGKEFETRLKEKKPGNLTDDLKTALGMPIGHGSEKVPPPWLIAMQRYGPPPSYPNLKIAGLNAPIPEGCSFGYHAGGWGKPPVDENGKPLYGDVFGTKGTDFESEVQEDDIDKSHWGELESESESEEESSEEEEEEGPEESGLTTPAEGLVTPSGITSIPVGMETPDMIELRKRRIEDAMDQGGETPALYQVLPEKKSAVGGAMMGSAHVYDVPGVLGAKKPGEKGAMEGVEIALNPEELDLDSAAMQAKYDQTIREQQSQIEKEDLSDMVAEHAAKQKKRKKKQEESGKAAKKYKEFKF